MPRSRPIQNSFTTGEISPRLRGRSDVTKYFSGVEELQNFIVYPHGGANRRPGTHHAANSKSDERVRLIPFEFNTEQTYILEFGNLYIRFYRNSAPIYEADVTITGISQAASARVTAVGHGYVTGGEVLITSVAGMTEINGLRSIITVIDPNTFDLDSVDSTAFTAYASGGVANRVYEIVSPYTTADLEDIQYAQSADTMWIVHKGFKPRTLTRTGHTAWTLANYAPTADPFTSAPLYPAAVTMFQQRIIFGGTTSTPSTFYASVAGDLSDMTVGTADGDGYTYSIVSGTGRVPVIRWLASSDVLLIGTAGSEFVATGGNSSAITPTNIDVSERATNGSKAIQPVVVDSNALFVQRAGRKLRDLGTFLTQDSSGNVRSPSSDLSIISEHITVSGIQGMAFQAVPDGILWMYRADGLAIAFTYNREQEVFAWQRHPLGGSRVAVESVAAIPSASGEQLWLSVRRVVNGQTVRHVDYMDEEAWRELSMQTDDDIRDAMRDCFYVDSGLSYENPVVISGITRAAPGVVTTASAHSLATADVIEIRDVLGMTEVNHKKYSVAVLSPTTFELKDENDNTVEIDTSAFGVYESDGILQVAVSSLSGLHHLEGEQVDVLADGAVHPAQTVTNGAIALQNAATRIHAGLNYASRLKTMPVGSAGDAVGSTLGRLMGWSDVIVSLYLSGSGAIQGEQLEYRSGGDPMDAPPALITETVNVNDLGYDKSGQVEITQEVPLPFTVLAISGALQVNE